MGHATNARCSGRRPEPAAGFAEHRLPMSQDAPGRPDWIDPNQVFVGCRTLFLDRGSVLGREQGGCRNDKPCVLRPDQIHRNAIDFDVERPRPSPARGRRCARAERIVLRPRWKCDVAPRRQASAVARADQSPCCGVTVPGHPRRGHGHDIVTRAHRWPMYYSHLWLAPTTHWRPTCLSLRRLAGWQSLPAPA